MFCRSYYNRRSSEPDNVIDYRVPRLPCAHCGKLLDWYSTNTVAGKRVPGGFVHPYCHAPYLKAQEANPKTAPAHAVLAPARDVVSSGPCYCPEYEHHDGVCMGPECHCHCAP